MLTSGNSGMGSPSAPMAAVREREETSSHGGTKAGRPLFVVSSVTNHKPTTRHGSTWPRTFFFFMFSHPSNGGFLLLIANTLPTLPAAIAASASMLPLLANMQQQR